MFSSLLRGRQRPSRHAHSSARRPDAGYDPHIDDDEDAYNDDPNDYTHDEDEDEDDADEEAAPLLPIFSAAHLDSLPVYDITHSIRLLVVSRCETTLSWEQLRSPQISQFLVKPIQIIIKTHHFSRATLYSLLANCLQFTKEGQDQPGNVGVLRTRAALAELLAMRLLKDFDARELIDALSYDFDPLSGTTFGEIDRPGKNRTDGNYARPASARTSTLEVAIRAQAKRFLAHPLVVQHLEAIWAGSIVFHNAADGLHRHPVKPVVSHHRHYGATHATEPTAYTSQTSSEPVALAGAPVRRSVTLYDPSNASLFKLSRLRVPKYRQIFSTCSYAILLGLFITVLLERSLEITYLECIFWFWSAGFVLDELIAYNEQGFGLYIQSVWNAFDIGILAFFLTYYLLRLYGIITYQDEKDHVADLAYDVLASTAILLFPRLFSLLDHYRYFSQLLIAFRLMAQDLIAVLLLVAISCSGFFVAFSLAFGGNLGGQGVAYALFQIVMGFTPAAWNVWSQQNLLGQMLLTVFLIICHFLVVTILVSVLTNSFMAIVKNANEEHQFLFAVNTISMVKSDALFSYVAPSNLLGWVISPLRYMIPFRHFVRVNRTIIKVTHFPVLFLIFAYERLRLAKYAHEPTALIERRGRRGVHLPSFIRGVDVFHPGTRVREPSAMTYHKDRALDEVFRHPYHGEPTIRKPLEERRASVVDDWMNIVGHEGGASPPMEQPRSILEQLERSTPRRPRMQRSMTSQALSAKRRGVSAGSVSVVSDPDVRSTTRRRGPRPRPNALKDVFRLRSEEEVPHQTDADGDDELVDEEEDHDPMRDTSRERSSDKENEDSLLGESVHTPVQLGASITRKLKISGSGSLRSSTSGKGLARSPGNIMSARQLSIPLPSVHNRQSSVNTILFNPLESPPQPSQPRPITAVRRASAAKAIQASPKKREQRSSKPKPIKGADPNLARFTQLTSRSSLREPSFDALALDLASDIGDNRHNDHAYGGFTVGSFQTQMADAMNRRRSEEEANRMGRIVLTRMNTLEEGFKDILKEVREWRTNSNSVASASARNSGGEESGPGQRLARRLEKKQQQKQALQDLSVQDIIPVRSNDENEG